MMQRTRGGLRTYRRLPAAGIGSAMTFGLAVACSSVYAANDCASLAAVTTEDSTVTSATVVAAGTSISGSVVPV